MSDASPPQRPAAPSSAELAVRTRGLTRRFGDLRAVDGIDLEIRCGEVFGLLGPNGAGKSTTIGMLTGSLRPSAGEIQILGRRYDPDEPWFKHRMGVVPESPPLFDHLRGREQLVLNARLFGLGAAEGRARAAQLLALLALDHVPRLRIAEYSRGMRRKLAIAAALIHAPRILYLDEPFEGVDLVSAATIHEVIHAIQAGGATVLITTHILEVAEQICDRVAFIHRGKIAEIAVLEMLRGTGESLRTHFNTIAGADSPPPLPDFLSRHHEPD